MSQRILVVDDRADMRDMVELLLRARGFVTDSAEDGAVALAKAEACTPDLVVTDLDMPRMDGLDLVRALRDRPATAGVPVILLTAFDLADQRVRDAERIPGVTALSKVQVTELVKRIRIALSVAA